MSPYYYVYNPLGRAPRVRHQSVADAQIEAERLADLHPDSCFEILMCLGHAKTHSATTRWADEVIPDALP